MEFLRASGVSHSVIVSFEQTIHESVCYPFRPTFVIEKLFEDKPDRFCKNGTYWFIVIK